MPFINEPDSSSLSSSNSSVVDAAAVNAKGIKTILANSLSTFFINGKVVVISGRKKLRNPPS